MSRQKCALCNEFFYDWQVHKCQPAWSARYEDYDDEDSETIHAADPQEAAEKYHERKFEGSDYQTDVVVIVTDMEDEHAWKVNVTVCQVPQFAGQVEEQLR